MHTMLRASCIFATLFLPDMPVLTRNNITITGSGETPMLLAHGYGCDKNIWRHLIPAFEKTHKLILFDHVGFGESSLSAYTPEKYNALQAYADDIIEICETLELREVIFVGHSVSAVIGALATIKKPEYFSKLVLVAPSPRYINDAGYTGGFQAQEINDLLAALSSDFFSWSSVMAPVIMGNSGIPALSDELTESFCRTSPEVAENFARMMFLADSRQDIPKITIKTLILQCTDDVIAPLEVGYYLHRNIPESTLYVMKATGHCPHVSAPQETIAAIRNFLEPALAEANQELQLNY